MPSLAWAVAFRRTVLSSVVFAAIAASSPATAQDDDADTALDEATDEYVADKFGLRTRAEAASPIAPDCRMRYPETATGVDFEFHDLAVEERHMSTDRNHHACKDPGGLRVFCRVARRC